VSSGQGEPDYPAILSSAAHDLRSPLSTIYGFARTIERIAPPPGPGAGFLAHILDAAQDMDRLLGHLSLLARIGDGRFAPVPAPVEAADLATRAAEGGAGERGADADGATVQAAADEAVEAIVLLATCARRLDPAHGTLSVCANGPAVVLTGVADEVVPFLGAGPGARDLALSTSLVTLRALGATIEVVDGAAHVTFPAG
jgi:hypothetical protein